MKLKKLTALALSAVCALSLAACGGDPAPAESKAPAAGAESPAAALPAQVQAIVDRGTLKVGVKSDVPGFGAEDITTGGYTGMEIDLAKAIAESMGLTADDVEYTPVTAKTRTQLLDAGDIDMVIATFTISEERKESWNFTTPYYTDAVSLLVKKDSGIKTYADLADKTIGVAESSTSKDSLTAAAAEESVTLTDTNFKVFPDYPSIKAALDSGAIDVFCVDGSILGGYLDDTTEILYDLRFAPQKYGIATKKDNTELADYLEGLVTGWLADGTIEGFRTANDAPDEFVG